MSQLTLRIPDRLAEELKSEAGRREMSVNRFATSVLAAAIDPDLGETDFDRLRGRLTRAGLLELPVRSAESVRPSPEQVAAARSEAGRGKPLSDFVAQSRH